MNLRTEIVQDFFRLESIAGEWDQLWKNSPVNEIFLKFSWISIAWKTYSNKRTLCTPLVFNNDQLVGILPLAKEGNKIQFIAAPRSDYNDLICMEEFYVEVFEAALNALLESELSWDVCCFDNVPEYSNIARSYKILSKFMQKRLSFISADVCPTLILSDNNKKTIIESILKKKSLKRHTKKLEKLGRLQFRHFEDREELIKNLPIFFDQHIARRNKAGDKSLFLDEINQKFYKNMVQELNPKEELRFSVLELDEHPVAYHLGFETEEKFVWYKPAFDIDYYSYSPGEVLIRNLFLYIESHKINEFDFTIGDEAFKKRFANKIRQNYSLRFFARGFRAKILRSIMQFKSVLKRMINYVKEIKIINPVY